ncbi:MAG: hypothetical protein J5662_06070 [Clostridia bacterium]|nr:hypothetical protein [Clostridia bacterium]
MSIPNIAVKLTAKHSLKNKYTSGIITASIFTSLLIASSLCVDMAGTVFGATGKYVLSFLFLILLLFPLGAGFVYWSVRLIFTNENEPVLIFKYFSSKSDYIKALKLSLLIAGNTLFTLILLSLPVIFTELLASGRLFVLFGTQIPIWASGLWGVARVLKALSVFLTVLVMLKYYMTPFLMAADEEMDPFEAIHMSKIISVRSKKDFIWLTLSFTGYIIACLFLVPMIFILPYLFVSYSVHCRFAVAAYNNTVDSINRPDIPSFNADISF